LLQALDSKESASLQQAGGFYLPVVEASLKHQKTAPQRTVFQTYKALNSYEVARIELSRSSCLELMFIIAQRNERQQGLF
jgi:hypothetical protein